MPKKRIFRRQMLPPHRRWKIKQFWKRNKWFQLCILVLALIGVGILIGALLPDNTEQPQPEVKEKIVEKEVVKEKVVEKPAPTNELKIRADNGYILGRYGNALDIEGKYKQLIKGSNVEVTMNPKEGFGHVEVYLPRASLNTEDQAKLDGTVKLVISRFEPFDDWQDKGIELDKEYFGDTKNGFDLFPTLPTKVAGFGTGDILLEDQEVYGNLKAMVFYSEGVRDSNLAIQKSGEFYSSKISDKNFEDKKDRELHIFMYQDVEDKKNFPPKTVWVNVFFEDPEITSLPDGVRK